MTRLPAVLAAAAVVLALPATASAATWTRPPGACYVSVGPDVAQRQFVPIRAQGFTPGARVDLRVDDVPADITDDGKPDALLADENGRVAVKVRAPYQARGERPFAITLVEQGNPANGVAATVKVTDLAARLRPASAPPSSKVRFSGRGFLARAPIWGHYVYRGKVRKTVRLVRRPRGDCGEFSVRRRQIPIVRPRTGEWTLQIDQQKRYSPTPRTVYQRILITVSLLIGNV